MEICEFEHAPTKALVGFYATVFSVVFVVLVMAPIGVGVRTVTMILWLLGLLSVARQVMQQKTLKKIRITEQGLELFIGGNWWAVRLLGQAIVSPYLIAFRCRAVSAPRRFYSLVLPAGSLDSESHRLLRIYFLHGKS